MRLDLFSPGDSVLLVGEGNFSFSACLLKHNLPISVVATCFEEDIVYESQRKNVDYLTSKDVPVVFNVDATRLHENGLFRGSKFTKIVFNFPHVGGKMKIQLNRDLLKGFFKSVGTLLGGDEEGSVLVSLCRGQGGTPLDEPRRSWHDSWQAVEMAAHGGFALDRVEPFCREAFSEYTCIGYRSQDVRFNLDGALVHVFVKRQLPYRDLTEQVPDERSKGLLQMTETVMASPAYAEIYLKNPLSNPKSLPSFMKTLLVDDLKGSGRRLTCFTDDDLPLNTSGREGIPCKVHNMDYKLRGTVFDVLETALRLRDEKSSDLILHCGLYFPVVRGKGLLKKTPVAVRFLLVGEELSETVFRYLHRVTQSFDEEKDKVVKRCVTVCRELTGTVKQTTEFVWEDLEGEAGVCFAQVHTIQRDGKTVEVCVVNADEMCRKLFNVESWKEIWAERTEAVVDSGGKVALKPGILFPLAYRFDLTLRYDRGDGFSEYEMREALWLAAGDLIDDVEFVNEYDSAEGWSSKCYRLTYKSWDRPLYREHVIDIHRKLIGPVLERRLRVKVG